MSTEKWVTVTEGLLLVSIVGSYEVVKFAPRIGATIGMTAYLAAGATAIAGVISAFKEN